MTNINTTKPTPKQPVFRKKLPGGISSAVFENEHDGRTYRSINIQRSYKKNGEWTRMSMYLDHEHIPFMIELLKGTWQFLNESPISSTGNTEGVPVEDQADDSIADQVPEFDA